LRIIVSSGDAIGFPLLFGKPTTLAAFYQTLAGASRVCDAGHSALSQPFAQLIVRQ
jgi:hypothetical protein